MLIQPSFGESAVCDAKTGSAQKEWLPGWSVTHTNIQTEGESWHTTRGLLSESEERLGIEQAWRRNGCLEGWHL